MCVWRGETRNEKFLYEMDVQGIFVTKNETVFGEYLNDLKPHFEKCSQLIILLKPTEHLKMDGWETILSFCGPRPIFRAHVSFREEILQSLFQTSVISAQLDINFFVL